MRQIVILTQYYFPEVGAPQRRLHALATRLVKDGHSVSVLTGMPNYPQGKIQANYLGKFIFSERLDGVNILRGWLYASQKKTIVRQLINYFSFMLSALVVGCLKVRHVDLLVLESPPIFLGFTAILLKWLYRARLVVNVSDLWPESAVQMGVLKNKILIRFFKMCEAFMYRQSSLITGQTEDIVFAVRKCEKDRRVLLWPNGVDVSEYSSMLSKISKKTNDKFVVGYAGNHGRGQALKQVLLAAKNLQNEDVEFRLYGDGVDKDELIRIKEDNSIDNIHFYSPLPHNQIYKEQLKWDISVVPLADLQLFHGARPSKMFELMAMGIPFVFCGHGEGAEIAEKSGGAVVVSPEDSNALSQAILRLKNKPKALLVEMGKNSQKFVEENFNRQQIIKDIAESIVAV